MWTHVTIVCQHREPIAEGKRDKKRRTSERQWSDLHSIGSDIRGCMSERRLKKYIKQHISHPQVETGRWSSQCQTAWCQLIWRAAAVAAVWDEPQKDTTDLEAVWNSTMRSRRRKKTKKQWRSILLRPVVRIYSMFHSQACPHCIQKFRFSYTKKVVCTSSDKNNMSVTTQTVTSFLYTVVVHYRIWEFSTSFN